MSKIDTPIPIQSYATVAELLDSIGNENMTPEIQNALFKTWEKIHGVGDFAPYDTVMVAVSGGADSDIIVDMIERVGHPYCTVRYVFYDTGVEFQATKRHLEYLESKYGITIERHKANVPVPIGVRKYGLPFLSKRISDYIHRLQRHNFQWEDEPFDVLYARYPKCKTALQWWCDAYGETSQMNIGYHRWLKEFMVENPPDFLISDACCMGAKKQTAHRVEKELSPNLNVQGIRKAEKGVRMTAHTSCFDDIPSGCSRFRPVFWFTKIDKETYAKTFGVTHSDCYTKYGLTRTGCACCPFGRNFEVELQAAQTYEPNLYRAAINVFGKSYEYTRNYRAFREMKDKEVSH